MTKRYTVRAGLLVATAACALALTAQAFAALTPKLTVATREATSTTTITYEQGAADDVLARVTVFAPATVFVPAAQTSGDPVGTATLTTAGGALSGAITARTGAESVTIGGTSTTLAAAWTACVGSPQPGPANTSNYWVIETAGTQPLQIPIFFSSINQDQPFGDVFLAQLNICFPQTLRVTKLALNLVESISASPGWSVWHVQAIPFSGTAQNPAGGAEAEAQDRLPWDVTLAARKATGTTARARLLARGKVVVSGKVAQGGRGMAGVTVQLLAGKRVVGSVKSSAGGSYRATIKTTATRLAPRAVGAARVLQTCVEPKFAPLPCTSSTVSGFDVTGDPVAVR